MASSNASAPQKVATGKYWKTKPTTQNIPSGTNQHNPESQKTKHRSSILFTLRLRSGHRFLLFTFSLALLTFVLFLLSFDLNLLPWLFSLLSFSFYLLSFSFCLLSFYLALLTFYLALFTSSLALFTSSF